MAYRLRVQRAQQPAQLAASVQRCGVHLGGSPGGGQRRGGDTAPGGEPAAGPQPVAGGLTAVETFQPRAQAPLWVVQPAVRQPQQAGVGTGHPRDDGRRRPLGRGGSRDDLGEQLAGRAQLVGQRVVLPAQFVDGVAGQADPVGSLGRFGRRHRHRVAGDARRQRRHARPGGCQLGDGAGAQPDPLERRRQLGEFALGGGQRREAAGPGGLEQVEVGVRGGHRLGGADQQLLGMDRDAGHSTDGAARAHATAIAIAIVHATARGGWVGVWWGRFARHRRPVQQGFEFLRPARSRPAGA